MYLLILYFPLISFVLCSIFGRFIGVKGAIFLALLTNICALICSCVAFWEVAINLSSCTVSLGSWLLLQTYVAKWDFLFDSLAIIMSFVVTLVTLSVSLFSVYYMQGDPHQIRFFSYLSLFSFFMLMLVTAANCLQFFFGWEGVGICSFLLISFWFSRKSAVTAALKAVYTNKLGDIALLIAFLTIYSEVGSLDFITLNLISQHLFYNLRDFIVFFIFIAAVGKSAQIGLHGWLPDAMEGPTPVSALIHAATMVTAGIFLYVRMAFVVEQSALILIFTMLIGTMTVFFGATVGLFQYDIKKLVAYSTCSQLGYMFLACGLSYYNMALFHLITHAFFKALLFLTAGIVIHQVGDEQDMRRMGGLMRLLPFAYVCALIASMSLAGLPFFSGFFSKELIIGTAGSSFKLNGLFLFLIALISAAATSFYSVRMLHMVFWSVPNGHRGTYIRFHNSVNVIIYFALIPLLIGSVMIGFVFEDLLVGVGSDYHHLAFLKVVNEFRVEYASIFSKFVLLTMVSGGAILSFVFHSKWMAEFSFNKSFRLFMNFMVARWYLEAILGRFFYSFFSSSFNIFQNLDRGFLEALGPTFIVRLIAKANFFGLNFASGFVNHYFVYIIGGLCFSISFYSFIFFYFTILSILLFFILKKMV